ncbi:MAG TPA: ArdC-like ssDNA-binding domain-containing protein [Ktedonobacteraceae bacterium]|nr:ArdC-like ssDNA-binding domain-containing protein [Ktedonobacteraceae bacterium]
MATTIKRTRTTKAKKPVFPIRALFLLIQKFHLLVIDGEAFAIKGKEHKYIKQADYQALLDLAWITPAHVIAEGLLSHEVTPLGSSIAAQLEEQNRQYQQLKFDLPELREVTPVATLDMPQAEAEQPMQAEQDQPAQPEQTGAEQSAALDAPQAEAEQPTQAEQDQPAAPAQPLTTRKTGKRPHYQSEEAKAARAGKRAAVQKNMQQAVSNLLAEIKAGKTDHLLNYLKFASKFHQYSPLNQMLIAEQAPNATHVAGYSQWKKLGYQVKKGEKGIAIIAPRPYGKAVMKNEETGEETITYLGVTFTVAYVFDSSQLEARPDKPIPSFFVPLADDQEALYTAIAKAVQKDGIKLEIGETGRAQGYSTGGKIRLQAGLDSTNRVLTLIHEWAHEKLHHNPQGRALTTNKRELHAEAISYVVAHHFGIHNPFSSDYLQNWGNNEKELLAELETIKATASAIIEQIEAK